MQDIAVVPVRTSAVLTGSYVAGTVLGQDQVTVQQGLKNQIIILINFTIGSLTSGQFKVEFSPDGNDWYQESYGTVATGVETDALLEHTLTATGKYRVPIPVKDNFVRISAKGTGSVTGSLMAIKAVVGIA